MSSAKFDIQFAGDLMQDADPEGVRRELKRLFKLSDESLARLFKGEPVTIKRGVDTATASSYRKLFRDAGALVHITPVEAESGARAAAVQSPGPTPPPMSAEPGQAAVLTLQSQEEQGKSNLEPPGPEPRAIDTGDLALVRGEGWTLEDCDRAPEPIKVPDISHLALVEVAEE